ncbi:MAG: nucleoside monophosphate kinase, partial [Candidatus Nomurabacteria bacterium]|nr:nucleoside monophosphate kinase [Candidatus Nomurabacteria bacterium]
MKIIGLFGPTGSGKSSQGKIMASWSGWAWVSTGELLRREGNDEILKQLFTSKLIDDMYVTKLLLAELKKVEADGVKVVVIDGYPRNAKQVSIMTENGLQVDMALDIKLSFDEAWARIKLRGR